MQARSCNHCCSGKAISDTYSEFVSVALVIQHENRMRHIVLPFMVCPALQNFTRYLINGKVSRKKKYRFCLF